MIEASIDFADEGDVGDDLLGPARLALATLKNEIDAVLAGSRHGERLREGLVVAIMGRPNVGKSALLNALAGREVAIVTPHAGTTRDLLEVSLDLGGYPVVLVDTAGLRDASDPVEQEGVRRARAKAAMADLVLWLDDGVTAAETLPPSGAPIWRVRSKVDLRPADAERLAISTISGEGLAALVAALQEYAAAQFPVDSLVTRARHRELLNDASEALAVAPHETEPELLAEAARHAGHALGRLLGRVDVEDVLGAIFSRFCIGK